MLVGRFSRHLTAVLLALLATLATLMAKTTQGDAAAQRLAEQVMKASGSDKWPSVKGIVFTFNVEQDGKSLMSAKHDWDLTKNTDTVKWKDKNVTIDLSHPPADGDAKAAYERWINDTYWLLMPLKLKDGGMTLTSPEPNVLHLSFQGVGLTPGDQYNVYINPTTHLPEKWDYMPAADKKTTGTWEDYKTVGGLTLSTKHVFGNLTITIGDLNVTTK